MRCEKGDFEVNLSRHLEKLAHASSQGCELVLFPEMSLTGSVDPSRNPERLMSLDDPMIATLATAADASGVAAAFGIAEVAGTGEAFITQVVVSDGRRQGIQRKRHLGDGEEHFSSATESEIFDSRGTRFAIAICAEAGFNAPFDDAAEAGARLVLFPSAPGLYGRRRDEASWRSGFSWWENSSLGDARRHAKRLNQWIALSGQAGSTLDEDFPGFAALVNPEGVVVSRLPDWREGDLVVDVPLSPLRPLVSE